MFEKFNPPDWLNFGLLIISALAFITATIAAYAAYKQFKASVQATRVTLLRDLYMEFRTNKEIATAFYLLEYDKFEYKEFHGSDVEPKIDQLLTLCDLVSSMYLDGTFTKKEIAHFEYNFKRIYQNQELQKYLEFLDGFYQANRLNKKSFEKFQTHARTLWSNQ